MACYCKCYHLTVGVVAQSKDQNEMNVPFSGLKTSDTRLNLSMLVSFEGLHSRLGGVVVKALRY